jgi:hypothetical protein
MRPNGMMQFGRVRLLTLLALVGTSVMLAEASGIAGTWRGESVCVTEAPSCHNENVVFYIKDVAERSDKVHIQADKIVNGKAITMGSGEWQHDRAQHTLEWRTRQQVWFLKVSGNRIEGTLTLSDGVVFRKIALERDH